MDIIKEISKWLMPVCITGCTARAIYCLIKSNVNEDDAGMLKKRAMNAIKFAIIAALAEAYFNGGKSI